jgi:ferritin-like metal-binding protein YciE
MSTKLDNLLKLFQDQIKDAYSAEHQLLNALPKMTDAATDDALREAFRDHLEETRGQAARLETVASELGFSPKGERCEAMQGLIAECDEVISNDDADLSVKDAALICAAQKVEHYEIALYGCLCAYARILSLTNVQDLLEQTLAEERAADTALTEIAEEWINLAAAQPEV